MNFLSQSILANLLCRFGMMNTPDLCALFLSVSPCLCGKFSLKLQKHLETGREELT